jgi:hypothetical protein
MMRAPVLVLALTALLGASSGAPEDAAAPAPLRQLDVAELTAMQARLAALAGEVQRALATASSSPVPAEAPKSKLEYLHDALMVRVPGHRSALCALLLTRFVQMSLDAMHDLRDATQARGDSGA